MNIAQINTMPREQVKQEMDDAASRKASRFLFRHRRANNDEADVEVYSGPVNIEGKVMLYSIIHDVSAKVQADRELLMSEHRFRLLVENAPYAHHNSDPRQICLSEQDRPAAFRRQE